MIGTTTIASVAPYPAEGLDWIEGMGAENIEEFAAVARGPGGAHPLFLDAPGPPAVT